MPAYVCVKVIHSFLLALQYLIKFLPKVTVIPFNSKVFTIENKQILCKRPAYYPTPNTRVQQL